MEKFLISSFCFSILLYSCKVHTDMRYPIYFSNETSKNVEVFILDETTTNIQLPEDRPLTRTFGSGQFSVLVDSSVPLDVYFSKFSNEKIHIYVIESDVLNTDSWTIIKNENKIITRYDLTINDLVLYKNVETIRLLE